MRADWRGVRFALVEVEGLRGTGASGEATPWNQLWFQIGRKALVRMWERRASSEGRAGRMVVIVRWRDCLMLLV